jgi:hypothetical protein
MRTAFTMTLLGTAFFCSGAIALALAISALPDWQQDTRSRAAPPLPPDLAGPPDQEPPAELVSTPAFHRPRSAPSSLTAVGVSPWPAHDWRCTDWRPLTMGSGAVRLCE